MKKLLKTLQVVFIYMVFMQNLPAQSYIEILTNEDSVSVEMDGLFIGITTLNADKSIQVMHLLQTSKREVELKIERIEDKRLKNNADYRDLKELDELRLTQKQINDKINTITSNMKNYKYVEKQGSGAFINSLNYFADAMDYDSNTSDTGELTWNKGYDYGLLIKNVTQGEHKLKFFKDGFTSSEGILSLKEKEVFTYITTLAKPKIAISSSDNNSQNNVKLVYTRIGNLKIQSVPKSILVEIPELNFMDKRVISKSEDIWTAKNIAEGVYNASFIWRDKVIPYKITIKKDRETHLFIDFINMEVKDWSDYSKVIDRAGNVHIDKRDGKAYNYLKIGNQTWMTENLAYLPKVHNSSTSSQKDACYYVYDFEGNDKSGAIKLENLMNLGVLYNFEAAKTACPEGWHLPNDDEWKKLELFIGMSITEVDAKGSRGSKAPKLKSQGDWQKDDIIVKNQFNVKPGGYRENFFKGKDLCSRYWTSSKGASTDAWYREIISGKDEIGRNTSPIDYGYSVRCIKN